MAHSRSALKRWRQSIARRDRNRAGKGRTRTLLNKALSGIGNDAAAAEADVKAAISALDKAAQKGIIHRNAASRSKSRLLKRYNLAQASAVAAAASAPPAPPTAEKPKTTRSRAAAPDDKPARGRTRKT